MYSDKVRGRDNSLALSVINFKEYKEDIPKIDDSSNSEEISLHKDIKKNFNIELEQRVDKRGNSKFIVKVESIIDINQCDDEFEDYKIPREFELQELINDKSGDVFLKLKDLGYMNEALFDELKSYLNNLWYSKQYKIIKVDDVFTSIGESISLRDEYKNIYLDFLDTVIDDADKVILDKKDFNKEKHIGVLEKNFKCSGVDCLLIDGDVLLDELGLAREQKDVEFRTLMSLWKKYDILYVRQARAKTQRNTFRYQLISTISYAVKLNDDVVQAIMKANMTMSID
ncbi:hypothetical protein [Clostridium sp.]|uniref:hypothetical protein n=1 Tax=Clostridium sp. TaxID=1506 RepID=UPI003217B900